MSGRIVAAGTFALDTIETAAGSAKDVGGGSAPWFAAAARAFAPVALLGVVGADYPEALLAALRLAGVDVTRVERRAGPAFRWHVRYDRVGGRETLTTNRAAAEGGVPHPDPNPGEAAALFLGSMDPEQQRAALDALSRPALVVADTMAHWVLDRRAEVEGVVARADVLLVTAEELSLLSGSPRREGAEALRTRGPSWVVVKGGAEGAVAYGEAGALRVTPAPPAVFLDPTGAGDAFAGGLVGALVEAGAGADPSADAMTEALRRASAAGSLAVEAFSYGALLAAGRGALETRARAVAVDAT